MGLVHLAFPFGLYGTVDLFFQDGGIGTRPDLDIVQESIPKPNGFYVGSLSFDKGGPGDEDIEFQVGIGQWVRHHGVTLKPSFLERRSVLPIGSSPRSIYGLSMRNNGGMISFSAPLAEPARLYKRTSGESRPVAKYIFVSLNSRSL